MQGLSACDELQELFFLVLRNDAEEMQLLTIDVTTGQAISQVTLDRDLMALEFDQKERRLLAVVHVLMFPYYNNLHRTDPSH